MGVAQTVIDVISSVGKVDPLLIDVERSLRDNGLDSLNIVVVREELEQRLSLVIKDTKWLSFPNIEAIIDFAYEGINQTSSSSNFSPASATAASDSQENIVIHPNGDVSKSMEIGMPLTGRNNLAEGPLLQFLGDLRWRHMCQIAGVPSKNVADEEGNRLYSTFFYVEIAFPERRPMASFGENDKIKFVGNMERFGTSMLDGTFFLLPETHKEDRLEVNNIPAAVAAGIPAFRLSNVFVMQFNGAEWLKKSRPANPGFGRIAEAATPPDSYSLVKQAEKDGTFAQPPQGYLPLCESPVEVEYQLVPDRDLNGAGLVYFANYPVFLDICERKVLENCTMSFSEDLINRRTLVSRKSAYLNNASANDTLSIIVEPWIENPFAKDTACPEMEPVRLFINYKMYRKSDNRLMMLSTASKLVFGRVAEDLPFFDTLKKLI